MDQRPVTATRLELEARSRPACRQGRHQEISRLDGTAPSGSPRRARVDEVAFSAAGSARVGAPAAPPRAGPACNPHELRRILRRVRFARASSCLGAQTGGQRRRLGSGVGPGSYACAPAADAKACQSRPVSRSSTMLAASSRNAAAFRSGCQVKQRGFRSRRLSDALSGRQATCATAIKTPAVTKRRRHDKRPGWRDQHRAFGVVRCLPIGSATRIVQDAGDAGRQGRAETPTTATGRRRGRRREKV